MPRPAPERRRAIGLVLTAGMLGWIAGPALDQIHVVGGALAYADPAFLDQAWWVAPQFALAFALILAVTLPWELRVPTHATSPSVVATTTALAWFVAAYVTTGALWERPWLVVALLTGGLVLRAIAERPDGRTIAVAALLAVGGTTYEALLSSIEGTFAYAEVAGLPVPPWLPLLYVHAAPLVRATMRSAAGWVSRPAPLP